jgi:hypothetical protein
MFDDLRDNDSPFLDEEQKPAPTSTPEKPRRRGSKNEVGFLGMTAQQRFVLSLLVFFMVCACGAFALILGGKISLPF